MNAIATATARGLADQAWRDCRTNRARLTLWVSRLTEPDMRIIAEAWLAEEMEARQRRNTLRVERRSEATTPRQPRTDSAPQPVHLPLLEELVRQVDGLVGRHMASLTIEWTPDLRRQPIRMPDGTETTWGTATLEQHVERAEMFEHYAATNVEGAARHRQAITDLTNGDASCLDDLMREAA